MFYNHTQIAKLARVNVLTQWDAFQQHGGVRVGLDKTVWRESNSNYLTWNTEEYPIRFSWEFLACKRHLVITLPNQVRFGSKFIDMHNFRFPVVLWPDIETALLGAFIIQRVNLTDFYNPLPRHTLKLLYILIEKTYGISFAVSLREHFQYGFLFGFLFQLRKQFQELAKQYGTESFGLLPNGSRGVRVSPFIGGSLLKKYQKIKVF